MKEGRKAKEMREKAEDDLINREMKDLGIPRIQCKNCGYRWYTEVVPVYPLQDAFVVECPRCNTPKHTS